MADLRAAYDSRGQGVDFFKRSETYDLLSASDQATRSQHLSDWIGIVDELESEKQKKKIAQARALAEQLNQSDANAKAYIQAQREALGPQKFAKSLATATESAALIPVIAHVEPELAMQMITYLPRSLNKAAVTSIVTSSAQSDGYVETVNNKKAELHDHRYSRRVGRFFLSLFLPFWPSGKVSSKLYREELRVQRNGVAATLKKWFCGIPIIGPVLIQPLWNWISPPDQQARIVAGIVTQREKSVSAEWERLKDDDVDSAAASNADSDHDSNPDHTQAIMPAASDDDAASSKSESTVIINDAASEDLFDVDAATVVDSPAIAATLIQPSSAMAEFEIFVSQRNAAMRKTFLQEFPMCAAESAQTWLSLNDLPSDIEDFEALMTAIKHPVDDSVRGRFNTWYAQYEKDDVASRYRQAVQKRDQESREPLQQKKQKPILNEENTDMLAALLQDSNQSVLSAATSERSLSDSASSHSDSGEVKEEDENHRSALNDYIVAANEAYDADKQNKQVSEDSKKQQQQLKPLPAKLSTPTASTRNLDLNLLHQSASGLSPSHASLTAEQMALLNSSGRDALSTAGSAHDIAALFTSDNNGISPSRSSDFNTSALMMGLLTDNADALSHRGSVDVQDVNALLAGDNNGLSAPVSPQSINSQQIAGLAGLNTSNVFSTPSDSGAPVDMAVLLQTGNNGLSAPASPSSVSSRQPQLDLGALLQTDNPSPNNTSLNTSTLPVDVLLIDTAAGVLSNPASAASTPASKIVPRNLDALFAAADTLSQSGLSDAGNVQAAHQSPSLHPQVDALLAADHSQIFSTPRTNRDKHDENSPSQSGARSKERSPLRSGGVASNAPFDDITALLDNAGNVSHLSSPDKSPGKQDLSTTYHPFHTSPHHTLYEETHHGLSDDEFDSTKEKLLPEDLLLADNVSVLSH